MTSQWFNNEFQEDLNNIATRMEIPAGTTIIEEDSENAHAYVILEGRVRAWALCDPLIDDSTQTILLDDIEAVDVVGEISAIDGKPQSATVESITDATVLRISSSHILDLMKKHPDFERHILKRLCAKLRIANDKIRDMRVLSSDARIGREILRMSKSVEGGGNQHIIRDFPTHAILAARCGVRRETVSRAIGRFLKSDLLKRDGSSVLIPDANALALIYDTKNG